MITVTVPIHQQGAALFISLILLLVMTLLGVSAVTTTTMEEKMAGNIRNKHLSFQAAEAALREGENIAAGLSDATTFNGNNGLYERSQPGDTDFPLWTQPTGINWQDVTTIDGLPRDPQYIIEDFSEAPRDINCTLEVPLPPGCLLPVYRVTARGWGINEDAMSMLQSTYKQL